MMERKHVSAIGIVTIAAFCAYLAIMGETLSLWWVGGVSITVTILGLAFWLFDKYLWRLGVLQGWFVKRPRLLGRWDVEFASDWIDPNRNERLASRRAKLRVNQTFSKLLLHFETDESVGETISASIIEKEGGQYEIIGVYRNEPRLSKRDTSQIHNGALKLRVEADGSKPLCLIGHYWTDRGTKGEFVARRL
jgi:SMODS-associating 2TM, beta-strand rich effector domain